MDVLTSVHLNPNMTNPVSRGSRDMHLVETNPNVEIKILVCYRLHIETDGWYCCYDLANLSSQIWWSKKDGEAKTFNLYNNVVLPALSYIFTSTTCPSIICFQLTRPNIKIRISFFDQTSEDSFDTHPPMSE